jgi:hypothetical protein
MIPSILIEVSVDIAIEIILDDQLVFSIEED